MLDSTTLRSRHTPAESVACIGVETTAVLGDST
jgi:hypothetical protein